MKVKNSNKVLILILFLTAAIPMLVAMILRHKVNTQQFEYVGKAQKDDPALRLSGTLQGVKAIKILGPDSLLNGAGLFNIILIQDQQNSYVLQRERNTDSLQVKRQGDTLMVAYPLITNDNKHYRAYYAHIQIYLHLPPDLPVFAENCMVQLSSWRPAVSAVAKGIIKRQNDQNQQNIQKGPGANYGAAALSGSVYLSKDARLAIGNRPISDREKMDSIDPGFNTVYVIDSTGQGQKEFNTTFIPMGRLQVFARNSKVSFIQPLDFQHLHLDIDSHSSLQLVKRFQAEKLSGNIADKTEIKGTRRAISAIYPLLNPGPRIKESD